MSEKPGEVGPYFPLVQKLALALPGVEQALSHGSTIFKVKKTFLTCLWDDGVTLVLRIGDMFERDLMLDAEPDIFFVTDHYKPWAGLLVRLPKISEDELSDLIYRSWRNNAPKKLVREYDAAKTAGEKP